MSQWIKRLSLSCRFVGCTLVKGLIYPQSKFSTLTQADSQNNAH